jgi:thiosulfate/3-mercaptopyruvate sulfurtransferase
LESTPAPAFPSLVSAVWLASALSQPDVVVLDCSWYLPSSGRDAEAEYRLAHIPGAVRFDLDEQSDRTSDLPHMLPTADQFAAALERIGVRPDDRVICYDGSGVNLSAARVWWMFRVFGHRQVAVLDGGFAAWTDATRPVQRGAVQRQSTGYPVPTLDAALVRARADLAAMVAGQAPGQVVDCRPAQRFNSQVDEPRSGVGRGHIPGSRNAPFTLFTDPATGLMKGPAELRSLLVGQGLDADEPLVALCGSGTSACVLALAVEVIRERGGRPTGPPVAIYDGSWSEWGRSGG